MGEMTLGRLLNMAERRLEAISESPGFEARCLAQQVFSLDHAGLVTHKQDPVAQDKALGFLEFVERRLSGEPLQYILGRWEFYSLPFEVGEGVLIPRADTETLVDCALKFLEGIKNPKVADLCSGSGCVAVSIAKNRLDCSVTAVELSQEAFPYLERNIALNGTANVTPKQADVLCGGENFGQFDLIVSNPPYIKRETIAELSREVLCEPKMALDGGKDGLVFYHALCKKWRENLSPGGALMVEIGFDQADNVKKLIEKFFEAVNCVSDLCGITRVVMGRKPIKEERKN